MESRITEEQVSCTREKRGILDGRAGGYGRREEGVESAGGDSDGGKGLRCKDREQDTLSLYKSQEKGREGPKNIQSSVKCSTVLQF